jgi:hypothetical protein
MNGNGAGDGGGFVVFWGAIVFGGWRFFRGLFYYSNPGSCSADGGPGGGGVVPAADPGQFATQVGNGIVSDEMLVRASGEQSGTGPHVTLSARE